MRVQGVIILLAALGAVEAQASSIETLATSSATPSIVTLDEKAAVDPSIVAAVPKADATPSIIEIPDTQATPSIISLGEPAPANEDVAATPQRATPTVIRGGEVGEAIARPEPGLTQPLTQPGVPLLDPNDKGTPAKRKALKRQAERLAREAAEAAKNPQPDASMQPVPQGE